MQQQANGIRPTAEWISAFIRLEDWQSCRTKTQLLRVGRYIPTTEDCLFIASRRRACLTTRYVPVVRARVTRKCYTNNTYARNKLSTTNMFSILGSQVQQRCEQANINPYGLLDTFSHILLASPACKRTHWTAWRLNNPVQLPLKVVCHLPTNSHDIFPRIGSHCFHFRTQPKCCPNLK